MRRFVSTLLGGRLQVILIVSFCLIAALTVGLNAWVISRVVNQYLSVAQDNRVARDMDLAYAFYQLKAAEISAVAQRFVRDPGVIQNLPAAIQGDAEAIRIVDQEITRKLTVPSLGGTHLVAVLDPNGKILVARALSMTGTLSPLISQGEWGEIPIVKQAISSGESLEATEVIPGPLLAQVGLDEQALITLKDTPKAAPEPFDPREGTAGLTLTSISPVIDNGGKVIGAVLVAHLFNNDFTLVDRIRDVAGVDTVTVFFGDLRVSTNVPDEQGQRAVGTRVSQDVHDVVLVNGQDFKGEAFVVKEAYITRYMPLHDHSGEVVGSLYVGARLSTFEQLIHTLNSRVALIALFSVSLAALIAIPITRWITQPIRELVKANQRLANGDMTVRVPVAGNGEIAVLGSSFNTMVSELDRTQQELLHKERLASMGQLAAGVAHEINNPLGTILLFSDVLYNETPQNEARRKDLKIIIDETNRCKRIVADLLNFSRQQKILAEEIDLYRLLEQVIGEVSHQESYQGIEVELTTYQDLPKIQCDENQMKQVFINLLNNAAEAIEGDGKITVILNLLDNQRVEVKISDTGCGVPAEHLNQLFTPFFSTKALGKGTGLGLSIAYGIIKMHRGQISIESQVAEGTTVTVTLPVEQPELMVSQNRVNNDLIG